jgi:tRNA A-37 threonylcarbamoyl transferase component Bud32
MKKLKAIRKLLFECEFKLSRLKRHGFIRRSTDSASGRIYINHKKGIVVKTPYICNRGNASVKHKIPTLCINVPEKYAERLGWNTVFVQPVATMKRLSEAVGLLEEMGCEHSDLKEANVGWYRSSPVVIDW